MQRLGAVILSGGASRRMKQNKAFLTFDNETFLNRIHKQLSGFEEILLSVDSTEKYVSEDIPKDIIVVQDIYHDCGALCGIFSALRVCKSDYLFVISCDMPLFEKSLADYMCSFVDGKHDAYVIVTRDGRLQPQCAIYSSAVADIMEECILAGKCKIIAPYDRIRVKYISLHNTAFSDNIVRGVNTPIEYQELLSKQTLGPISD